VSLSCLLSEDRGSEWWLTKERGTVPLCGNATRCGYCWRGCMPFPSNLRRSYVLIICDGGFCTLSSTTYVFSLLCQEGLRVAEVLSAKSAQLQRAGLFGAEWRAVVVGNLTTFSSGGYSRADCLCSCMYVCEACALSPFDSRVFWSQQSFLGVYPAGAPAWFAGVSDAAGGGRCLRDWLSCPLSATIARRDDE
jgi:hypothetical protein